MSTISSFPSHDATPGLKTVSLEEKVISCCASRVAWSVMERGVLALDFVTSYRGSDAVISRCGTEAFLRGEDKNGPITPI